MASPSQVRKLIYALNYNVVGWDGDIPIYPSPANKNLGARFQFLNSDNPLHWVNDNYGDILNPALAEELHNIVSDAKIIFPDLYDTPPSKFAQHVHSLFAGGHQVKPIPNDDAAIL